MTPDERQGARDRAADAIAPRAAVVIGAKGWASPPAQGSATEQKRRSRARLREQVRA